MMCFKDVLRIYWYFFNIPFQVLWDWFCYGPIFSREFKTKLFQKPLKNKRLQLYFKLNVSCNFDTGTAPASRSAKMSVTLHCDVGDIKIELFCEQCPNTCYNFLSLAATDYYNGCLFHRNIKGFIVQTGDPTGKGKGGTSIWEKKFNDEISDSLKHNARGMVSMANSGPNSNLSQFFITYAAQPSLDLKYTCFGKVKSKKKH